MFVNYADFSRLPEILYKFFAPVVLSQFKKVGIECSRAILVNNYYNENIHYNIFKYFILVEYIIKYVNVKS